MFNLIISLFSVVLTSYVLSKYFFLMNLDDNYKYKRKRDLKMSLIFSLFSIIFFYVGYCLNSMLITYVSLACLIGVIGYEICISIIKISYYDKRFKLILNNNDNNINRDSVKKMMVIDAIKDIFYCLGIPFLFLEYLINRILDIIFT